MSDWQAAVDDIAETGPDELQLILVQPDKADDVGGAALQAAADKAGIPVAVSPGSEHHENRIYWPTTIR